MAFSLFLLVGACRAERGTPAATDAISATSEPPASIPEADYRGELNGANVYATIEAHGTIASGSCFYDASGALVPLRGALDEHGVLMLQEMDDRGPVSTIVLQRDASGGWFGTWSSEDESRSGNARLEPLVRRAGEPVFVATRRAEIPSVTRCGSPWAASSSCEVTARVPVVLGLADRAFEHALDDRLASRADMRPPPGDGAIIDYVVPLNARGFVSFEITARWTGPAAHGGGTAAGLTAAVDAGEMADGVDDFVDVPKARDADLLSHAHGAVLTDKGLALLVGGGWRDVAFPKLAGAMRGGTPFTGAWSR